VDATDAVRHMVKRSGLGGYGVSRAAGRAQSYVSVLIRRDGDVASGVLADLAHACGYRLQLVGRGETIDIDGTRRDPDGAGEG
jgi:hypothetical protein